MSTISDFRARYPQFASVTDETLGVLFGDVVQELSSCAWGGLYAQAAAALVAHKLEEQAAALNAGAIGVPGMGTAGTLTSLRTGDLAMGFGAAAAQGGGSRSAGDALYAGTIGGREYLRLRGRLRLGPRVTSGGGCGC